MKERILLSYPSIPGRVKLDRYEIAALCT